MSEAVEGEPPAGEGRPLGWTPTERGVEEPPATPTPEPREPTREPREPTREAREPTRWDEVPGDWRSGGPTAIPDCGASKPAPGSAIVLEEPASWELVATGSGLPVSVTWTIGGEVVGPVAVPPGRAPFDWRTVVSADSKPVTAVPVSIEVEDGLGGKAGCAYEVFVESLETCRFEAEEATSRRVVPLEDGGAFAWTMLGGVRLGAGCEEVASWEVPKGVAVGAWWDETCERPVFHHGDNASFAWLHAPASPACAGYSISVPWWSVSGPSGSSGGVVWVAVSDVCLKAFRISDGEPAGPPFCPGEVVNVVSSAAGRMVVRTKDGDLALLLGIEVLWKASLPLESWTPWMTVIAPGGAWIGAAGTVSGKKVLHVLDAGGALAGNPELGGWWSIADDGTGIGTKPWGSEDFGSLVAWRDGALLWSAANPLPANPKTRLVDGDRLWLFEVDEVAKLRAVRLSDGALVRALDVAVDSWKTDLAVRSGVLWLAGTHEVVRLRADPLTGTQGRSSARGEP